MKKQIHKLFLGLGLITLLGFCHAQTNPSQCISKVQKRIDTLKAAGDTKFNFHKAFLIVKEFDFGKTSDIVKDSLKATAYKRIWTSMAEFSDLAPNDISGNGYEGYIKFSGVLIREADTVLTEANINHLRQAFTKGGNFQGSDFDVIMKQLGDDTQFSFDPNTRTFTSSSSGLKYGDGPKANGSYNQGETNAVTHILRGHLENDYSVPAGKSLFKNAGDVFSLIDDAWSSPNKVSISANGWEFDFTPKVIGSGGETKIRFFVDGDKVRSAFPVL